MRTEPTSLGTIAHTNKAGQLQLAQINEQVEAISQRHYADHQLDAVSGAGSIDHPRLALVFINPTHRNISTDKMWRGLKAPWIGCANIWQMFADSTLIDTSLNQKIQRARANWSESFAREVYNHIAARGLYITNIVKWAGLDARLPERDKVRLYSPILIEELQLIRARYVVTFGQLTFDSMLRELHVKSSQSFGALNERMLGSGQIESVQTEVGEVVPCYFPVGQGTKNKAKAIEILKLVSA